MKYAIIGKNTIRFEKSKTEHEVYISSKLIVKNESYFRNTFELECTLEMIDEILVSDNIFIVSGMFQKKLAFKILRGEYPITEGESTVLYFRLFKAYNE